MIPLGLVWGSALELQNLLLFAGIALFVLTMVRMSVRRARRAREQALAERSLRQPPRQTPRSVQGDQHGVELYELFREMSARLDTKIHVLNELLIEAEQRIAELRGLTGAAEVGSQRTARSAGNGRALPLVLEDCLVVEPEPLAGESVPQEPSADPTTASAGPRPEIAPRFAQVCELAEQGLTSHEISERLGQPIGEVELILGLYRRRRNW